MLLPLLHRRAAAAAASSSRLLRPDPRRCSTIAAALLLHSSSRSGAPSRSARASPSRSKHAVVPPPSLLFLIQIRCIRRHFPPSDGFATVKRFTGKLIDCSKHEFGSHTRTKYLSEILQWLFLSGQAAFIVGACSSTSMAEDVSTESSSKSGTSTDDFSGLRKVENNSVISNEHTSKWRVFTDNGRDYFVKGNIDQAEKFFLSALQEAKEGFGERNPHVASACNNLAELYRVKKDLDKAEPLYVEAINILEENFGVNDVRVGATLHNLGHFYLGQRKLEKARVCYERALKIKRRVLGEAHTEYADTYYVPSGDCFISAREREGC